MSNLRDFLYHEEDAGVIYCGDCLEILPLLPDRSVDLVVTDIPFNLGKKYGTLKDDHPEIDYWNWTKNLYRQLFRIMDWGYLFAFHSDKGIFKLHPLLTKIGLNFLQMLIWNARNGYSMQFNRKTWSYRHEPILVFEKGNAGYLNNGKNLDSAWYTSVLEVPRPQSNFKQGRHHPTEKPMRLFKLLIQRCPFRFMIDPTCGIGASLVAAKRLGKEFMGIEINPAYCEIAKQRLAQEELPL